ncbi:phosphate acyltransferase PlsX [Gordonibacter massiliensis (ex Traore et al. 2017)]|uniref:phosphate acyltransferase PlsX n=1 Tax=Gordonibacter massiliensis (ex Traore et al. 2017) TaxID=1841863 RepID=UPI0009B0A5AB|nr:phosphate acyltransferase PlsX [Gordonibacter massiliensis (ex Traore et al. 2017)]MBX9033256.1 phosphate acyltransferase PlsX [Gordonibacter massiliensis (ex Traore et al. 2017)]
MADKVTIAVDAMGGDDAPGVVLDGVAQALAADEGLHVVLCGPADVAEPFAAAHERCEARATTEVIGMGEHPAEAVRKKKDSSIVVGCRLVKEGEAQGFFSAGSTGACLAAGTLVMGRIKGVARPALATVIPSPVRPVVMCDVGANADCKPSYLVQFAQMATIYAEKIVGIERPRAALLNIGEEEAKGSQFAQEAHALLREQLPNFAGNAEGGDILAATYDVIVTDGFTGNVCLKTIEGTSKTLFKTLKGIMMKTPLTKLGALAIKGGLKELMAQVSPDTYGGAPLLGVKGACIVGHGSSNAYAVKNGVLTTAGVVRAGVSEIIAQTVAAGASSATME